METKLDIAARVAKNAATTKPSFKVCMHVLGIARTDGRVMREATALVEAGFDVFIVDVEADSTLPLEEEIQGVCVKHIIVPRWLVSTTFKPWSLIRAIYKCISAILHLMKIGAHIYHAHDVTALPASYIAARLRRKPIIFDAHELPLSELDITHQSRFHALLASLLARVLPHCTGVITVSLPIAQQIHECYRSPEVSLIRNIPAYQMTSKSDRLRQYLKLSPETRIALYQGNLQSNRGLDKLIRAAAFVNRNTVIVMMGKGIGASELELEALIRGEEVADRVKIIPPVPYAELLEWTASADIGLIIYSPDYSPNVRMCLPNKLFEYLMAGLPVLASPLDAVADILRTYEVGQIVSSLTPSDIGAAINTMLTDPDTYIRMHRNALEVAKHEFCWEKESQRLIRLYQSISEVQNA